MHAGLRLDYHTQVTVTWVSRFSSFGPNVLFKCSVIVIYFYSVDETAFYLVLIFIPAYSSQVRTYIYNVGRLDLYKHDYFNNQNCSKHLQYTIIGMGLYNIKIQQKQHYNIIYNNSVLPSLLIN